MLINLYCGRCQFSRRGIVTVVLCVFVCLFSILAGPRVCFGEDWEVADFLAKISYERQEIKNGSFEVEWNLKRTIRVVDAGGDFTESVTSVSYVGRCAFDHQTKKSIFRYQMIENNGWGIGDGVLNTEYVSLYTPEYFGIYDPSRPNDAFFMFSQYKLSPTNGPWFSAPDPRAVGFVTFSNLFSGIDLFSELGRFVKSEEKGYGKPYIRPESSDGLLTYNQFLPNGRTRKVLTVDTERDWLPIRRAIETGEPFENISDYDPKWVDFSQEVEYGECDGITVPIECSAKTQAWDYPANPEAPPDSLDEKINDMVLKIRWENCNTSGLSANIDYKNIGLPVGCDIVDFRGESPNVIDRITRTGTAALAHSPRKNVNSWVLGGFVIFVGLVFVGLLFVFITRKKLQA